ncbi:MAG: glycosyltransferase [Flavobacteriia bacterium]|nr:glycosyltransferase [Flavobacteriia bacterium]
MNFSPNYRPKVVFISSRFPFPIDKGDKLRAYFQIRDLSAFFDLILICTSEVKISEKEYNELNTFCKEIHVFYLKKSNIFIRLFFNIFKSLPFQVSYFYSFIVQKRIDEILKKTEPDHIFCQLIRSAEYVKNYHYCSKSIDVMDALSLGMKRRLSSSSFFIKWIIRVEYKRLLEYEKYVLDYFENKFIISEEDRSHLLYPEKQKIMVLANGVNEKFLTKRNEIIEKEFDLLFTGNMGYFPNIEATLFIYKELFPELKKMGLKTVICGTNPSPQIIKLNNPSFVITGWVKEIKTYYANSKLFIAPMFSGSGMQNKIIEAMAMGIPCICTSMSNKSINATHLNEIYIADNKNEMLNAIILLLNDKELYLKLSQNSHTFVKNHFDWKIINSTLKENILNSIQSYNNYH